MLIQKLIKKFIIDVDSVVQYKELSQDFVSDLIYYRYDYQAQKKLISMKKKMKLYYMINQY
ncbi:hypothetical protein OTSUT76_2071 [Orientia tsutsugamushi str. UT76]|nr:hypothetical protein OTSUT76_2071 [Orientia tsutsugamushi str. UT76]